MVCLEKLGGSWAKKWTADFRRRLWVYRAIRRWERAGNRMPNDETTLDEREKIWADAYELIRLANESELVLTISTQPNELSPLAMGNHSMVPDVRPSRKSYQKEGGRA